MRAKSRHLFSRAINSSKPREQEVNKVVSFVIIWQKMHRAYAFQLNRTEDNDHESIQLPNNTFRPRHQKGKKGHTQSNGTTIKTLKQKTKRIVFVLFVYFYFKKNRPNGYPKLKTVHQNIHAKTYNDINSKPQ